MWSTVRLFLTLVQITFSKLNPLSRSALLIMVVLCFQLLESLLGLVHCWILYSLTVAVFNQKFTKFLQNEQWALVSSTGHLEHFSVPLLRSEKASACLSHSLLSPVPRMSPNVCLEDVLFTGLNENSKLGPGASLWDSSLYPMRTRSLVGSEEAPERRGSRDCLHLRAGCQSPAFWWGVSTQAVTEGRGERTASPSVSLSSSFIRPDISLPRLRCGLLMYQWGDFLSHQSSVWVGSDGNKITSSEMEQVIPVTWHRCQRGCAKRNMSFLPSSSHQLFSYLGILPGGACAYFSQKTFYIFSCVYNDGIMLYALSYTWFFFHLTAYFENQPITAQREMTLFYGFTVIYLTLSLSMNF